MEPTNIDRASWAGIAIDFFARQVGEENEDDETIITDLLADLMHYCKLNNIDFSGTLDRATDHFSEEIAANRENDATI